MGKIETDQTAVKVLETPSQRAANLIERFNREIHKLEYPSSAQHCTKQQSVELSLKEELNSTAHTFNISSKKCEEEKMKLPNFTLPSHFICPRDERNTISRNTSPESPKFGPKTMVLSYCSQPVMVKETTSSSALTIISNDDLNPPESNNTMNKNKTVKVSLFFCFLFPIINNILFSDLHDFSRQFERYLTNPNNGFQIFILNKINNFYFIILHRKI
uniref:Uncharacterized protein n=1 Tax=Heterorhabditis bacteriophora TaxID=37862 RepID=A0A1I7WUD3_HETBA